MGRCWSLVEFRVDVCKHYPTIKLDVFLWFIEIYIYITISAVWLYCLMMNLQSSMHPSVLCRQADTVALPPPAHSLCSCSSAVGWWSWTLSGNCNPLLSPRETRTPISDPASFKRGENAHKRVGDECSERQKHVRCKNREKAGGVRCRGESRFSSQSCVKLSRWLRGVFFSGDFSNDFTVPQGPQEEGIN